MIIPAPSHYITYNFLFGGWENVFFELFFHMRTVHVPSATPAKILVQKKAFVWPLPWLFKEQIFFATFAHVYALNSSTKARLQVSLLSDVQLERAHTSNQL